MYCLSGEIEELKQDLSSFRFEVLNAMQTQKHSLQESINSVSAKMDMYSAVGQFGGKGQIVQTGHHHKKPHHPSVIDYQPMSVELMTATSYDDIYDEDYYAGMEEVQEEIIVPHRVLFYEDGKEQLSKQSEIQQDIGPVTDEDETYFSSDMNPVSEHDSFGDDNFSDASGIDVDQVMLLQTYKCASCLQREGAQQRFKPKYIRNYSAAELDRFIQLMNQMKLEPSHGLPSTADMQKLKEGWSNRSSHA